MPGVTDPEPPIRSEGEAGADSGGDSPELPEASPTPEDAARVVNEGSAGPDSTGPVVPPPADESAPPAPEPRVLAVANQKGGVGKTTTAVNLGAALAGRGQRVLLVDLDPQANATTGVGVDPRTQKLSTYEVLLEDAPVSEAIVPTATANLDLLPSSLDLAGAEIELVSAFSRESKLRNALEPVLDGYDTVLIDCPPSLGLLTINGLAAAREVLVPIQCEYYALEGLGQLVRNVELVRRNLNPGLEVSTIVLVMYDGRTKLADEVAREVRAHFPDKVCTTVIPRNIRLSEAPSYGQPITEFDPTSRGAVAYRELAEELMHGAT